MKSLLQPYIEKQILLEDNKKEAMKKKAELKGKMYTLVWDVLNSRKVTGGFAHKLSDYVSKIIAGKKPNPPSSKNLKSSEVKNLVGYGDTIAQKWHGWDWKKNPPKPITASWEKGWLGDTTKYEWGNRPSKKATPGNAIAVYGSDSKNYFKQDVISSYDKDISKHTTNLAKAGSTGVDQPVDHDKEVEAGKASAVAKNKEEKERANAEKKSVIGAAFSREHEKTYNFIRKHFVKNPIFFDELYTYDKEQVELLAQIASQYRAIVNESLAFNLITEELTSDDLSKLSDLTNEYFKKYGDGTPDEVIQVLDDFQKQLNDKTSTEEPPKQDPDDKQDGEDLTKFKPSDREKDPKDKTPLPTQLDRSLDGYKWKNWGKESVAKQVGNWSTGSENQQRKLRREIQKLLKIFGNKAYITGMEARNIKTGKISDFQKVFMNLGEDPNKSPASNEGYAVQLMSPDLLQGYLDGKNKLYFNINEKGQYFWEDEPSATGGQTTQTIGKKGGWFSDDEDAEKYAVALLAYAETYPQKVQNFIIDQGVKMAPDKTINLGDTKVPAAIFMDGNYVNQIWKHWATELDGTVKTLPIWDNENKRWRPNKSGESSTKQEDTRKAIRTNGTLDPSKLKELMKKDENIAKTLMLLGVVGLVSGPLTAGFASTLNAGAVGVNMTAQGILGTGLGALGFKYGSLSNEQKVELALMSTNYGNAMLEDMDRQIPGYRNAFKSALPFDIADLFKIVMTKKPELTAGQLADFRRTLRIPGTLMKISGGGLMKGSYAESVQQTPSFRNLIDLTSVLNERPVPAPSGKTILKMHQVSPYQIQNANAMLDAMGLSSDWRFVQPKENTEVPQAGLSGGSSSVGTYRVIDPKTGQVTVEQTIRSYNVDDEVSKDSINVQELEPVVVQPIPDQPGSDVYIGELVVGAQSEIVKRTNGETLDAAVLVKDITAAVIASGTNLTLDKEGKPVEPDSKIQVGDVMEDLFTNPESKVGQFVQNPELRKEESLSEPANVGDEKVAKTSKENPPVTPIEELDDDEGPQDDKTVSDDPTVAQGDKVKVGDLGGQDEPDEEDETPAIVGAADDLDDEDDLDTGPDSILTSEQITAIKQRLSKGGYKSGPRDPGGTWSQELQQAFKIGGNGTKANFDAEFKKVSAVVTNSTTATGSEVDLSDVNASVIPAGTRIKMYDDALKSGLGAEIMKQVTDSDPNFAKIWNARKDKTFALAKDAAIFYYFGLPIQVATTKEQFVALQGQEKKSKEKPPEETKPEVDQTTKPQAGKYSIKITQNSRGRNDRFPNVTNVIDPSGKVVKSWQPKNGLEVNQIRVAAQDYVNKMNAQASAGGSIDDHFINVLGKEKYEIWKKVTGDLSNNEKICVLAMMRKGYDLKLKPTTESVQLNEAGMWDLMRPLVKMALRSAITKVSLGGFGPAIKMIKNWTRMSDDQIVAFLKDAKKSGKIDNWMNVTELKGMRDDAMAFAKTAGKGAVTGGGKATKASMQLAKDASVQGAKTGQSGAKGTLTKVKDLIKKHPKKSLAAGGYGAWKLFFDKNEELNCDVSALIQKVQQAGGDLVNTGRPTL